MKRSVVAGGNTLIVVGCRGVIQSRLVRKMRMSCYKRYSDFRGLYVVKFLLLG